MTWPDYMAARQLLAEERVGTHHRAQVREEDDAIARSTAGLRQDMARGAIPNG